MCIALNFLIALILGLAAGNLIDSWPEPSKKCLTPNNERGECVPLYACTTLAKGLRENPVGHIDFVRKSRCGGNPYDTRICCGTAKNFTLWKDLFNRFDEEGETVSKIKAKCTMPDGVEGVCSPINKCPPLLRAFANPLKGLKDDFEKFRCGNDDTYVCCDHGWVNAHPLSNFTYCGLQRADDSRPVTDRSRTTTIDEFPWLAAIIVPKLDNKIVCQGVLINHRYILTAAQCFGSTEYLPEDVSSVRLGGYHINDTNYCVELSQYNATDCTTTEEFGIEERIVHDFHYQRVGLNDIALLRLDRNVSFTDFIRPICLPIQGTKFAKPGDTMYVTGWGRTSHEGALAQVKKKILTSYLDSLECEERLKSTPVRITPLKMCTVDSPLNKEFTCSGDAGGPVMFAHRSRWHIEGITSKGWPCGRGYPEVKTRVSQYLAWIQQNIRP